MDFVSITKIGRVVVKMSVITYNDQLRNLLADVDCVLAFDTAADFWD